MGFSVWGFFKCFPFYDMNFLNKLIVLAGSILIGLGVYGILSLLFNTEELKAFRLILFKKKVENIRESE